MSFDIYLICVKNGESDRFPMSIIEEAFGPFARCREKGHWELVFPDGGGGTVSVGEGDSASGFAMNRPGGDDLYHAIYEIMRQTQTVLSWSFGGAATAHASVIPHIPPEMIESVGSPTIVHSGAEIIKAIVES